MGRRGTAVVFPAVCINNKQKRSKEKGKVRLPLSPAATRQLTGNLVGYHKGGKRKKKTK